MSSVKKVGARQVIASDSFVTQGEAVEFDLYGAVVAFEFVDNGGEQSYNVTPTANGVRVQFLNCDNSLGTSFNGTLGQMNNKDLRVSLIIWTVGSSNKTYAVNFTISQ